MKKIITLCAALAFTSSIVMAAPSKKISNNLKEGKAPEVWCSTEFNGITYTTWGFTATHCVNRLAKIISDAQ